MELPDLDPILSFIIAAHTAKSSTLVVGVTGGVAVGKSTFSDDLARLLNLETGLTVVVVASDGFLHRNSVLEEMGISDRKGFPESYDARAIEQFLTDVRSGSPAFVPVYDHHTYDVTNTVIELATADMVLFEGVNALQFAEHLDIGLYLHADEPVMRAWFVERTRGLREAARSEYSPFFDPWLDVPDDVFLAMVNGAWEMVNLPNLVDHIEPTQTLAHAVIEWEADHGIRVITFRESL